MGTLSIWHWLIVLVIVMLVFGTKKIKNIGSDLGAAVKGFKDGIKEGSSDTPAETQKTAVTNQSGNNESQTIDVEAKTKV